MSSNNTFGSSTFIQEASTLTLDGYAPSGIPMGHDLVLTPAQCSTKLLYLVGSLTGNRSLTFPWGYWKISTQDLQYNKYSLTILNGVNSAKLNANTLYDVSITMKSIAVK